MSAEPLPWLEDDGGRAAAGYKGTTGDCGCRAVAIAFNRPYQEIYDRLVELGKEEAPSRRRKTRSHPRTGVYRETLHRLIVELGGRWCRP